jgi:hypothetical protein
MGVVQYRPARPIFTDSRPMQRLVVGILFGGQPLLLLLDDEDPRME